MKLVSTFRDYYDPFFDKVGPEFHRIGGNSGPTKPEQFRIMKEAGFFIPPIGKVTDVLSSWWEEEKCWIKAVVAYTDENAHCTEGKELWWKQCKDLNIQPRMGYDAQNERAYKNFELFCSAFVGAYPQLISGGSCSLRRLQVGPHVFWIEYKSNESWMSNFGEGSCEVVGIEKDAGFHHTIKYPLWAVDMVYGKEAYAIDFNTAPGIRGSGVDKILIGAEIVDAIQQAYDAGLHGYNVFNK